MTLLSDVMYGFHLDIYIIVSYRVYLLSGELVL